MKIDAGQVGGGGGGGIDLRRPGRFTHTVGLAAAPPGSATVHNIFHGSGSRSRY